jgi:divalent metal cation (Fe/Co/Zn/Cd) transporter
VLRLVEGLTGSPPVVQFTPTVMGVALFTIVAKAVAAVVCTLIARQTGSLAVRAYAQDHQNDVMSNILGMGGELKSRVVRIGWSGLSSTPCCVGFTPSRDRYL